MLCIDEFRSTDKQMSFIAVDAQTHDIITILPGRKNADIKDFFLNHYSKRHRDRVTRVVMDFNSQYQPAIRTLFLHAKLVADSFHLVQMALRSLNQTRVQLMKRFNPQSREYRVLKYYWRLYLKDYDGLEKRKSQWFVYIKNRMTQEQLVVAGLNLDQQFRQTYQASQKYYLPAIALKSMGYLSIAIPSTASLVRLTCFFLFIQHNGVLCFFIEEVRFVNIKAHLHFCTGLMKITRINISHKLSITNLTIELASST